MLFAINLLIFCIEKISEKISEKSLSIAFLLLFIVKKFLANFTNTINTFSKFLFLFLTFFPKSLVVTTYNGPLM